MLAFPEPVLGFKFVSYFTFAEGNLADLGSFGVIFDGVDTVPGVGAPLLPDGIAGKGFLKFGRSGGTML